MKGPAISLKHLQRAVTMELTTVNQYLLQAHKLDDWGIDRLAKHMFHEVKEEGVHASRFIERMMLTCFRPGASVRAFLPCTPKRMISVVLRK